MAGNSRKCHLCLLFLFILCNSVAIDGYKLKQVVALSRHNVRTPLTANLYKMTPKQWPKWNGNVGELTPRGALLEGIMGKYFYLWLTKERLLSESCPTEDLVYIYSNTRQRTKASAKAFVNGAFENCSVPVHHKNTNNMDPVFNPIIRNSSEMFKDIVIKDMQNKLDKLQLRDAFLELERIIDFKNSILCKTESICHLADLKSDIVYEVGEEPNLSGPLAIGNALVDSFIMSYYDNFPLEEVAWGEINNTDHWKLLMNINKENHNIRFNATTIARDAAILLIEYMSEIFLSGKPKFALLMGHDSNIYTIVAVLGFIDYNLPDQYEKTPTGGKLVFQKWYDEKNDRDLLKVDYVYQSMEQLREMTSLSLDNPPQKVSMQIRDCKVDEDGYCLWSDFVKILKKFE